VLNIAHRIHKEFGSLIGRWRMMKQRVLPDPITARGNPFRLGGIVVIEARGYEIVFIVTARHLIVHPVAFLAHDGSDERGRRGRAGDRGNLRHGGRIFRRRVSIERKNGYARVREQCIDAACKRLIQDSVCCRDKRLPLLVSIEFRQGNRRTSILPRSAVVHKIELKSHDGAFGYPPEIAIDPARQIAQRTKIELQSAHKRRIVGLATSKHQSCF
jgi:hypothetical protein